MKEKQIDALLENIDMNLTNGKNIIESFDKLPPSEQEAQLQNLDQLKQQINSDLLMFETMLNTSKRKKTLMSTKDDLAERQMTFENNLEHMKKAHFKIPDPPASEAVNSNNAVLIDLGDQIGQEAIEKGEEVVEKLKKANQMLLNIEDEIYEQRLKLLRIKDNISESQSLINRGKEVIDYFSKAMARDKFIRVAVLLMAILMIGIFVMIYLFTKSQKVAQGITQEKELKAFEDKGIKMENGKITLSAIEGAEKSDYLLLMENKVINQGKSERDSKKAQKEVPSAGEAPAVAPKQEIKPEAVSDESAKPKLDQGVEAPKRRKVTRELKVLSDIFRWEKSHERMKRHHGMY